MPALHALPDRVTPDAAAAAVDTDVRLAARLKASETVTLEFTDGTRS